MRRQSAPPCQHGRPGWGVEALRHSLLTPLPTSVLKMLWKKATMVLKV